MTIELYEMWCSEIYDRDLRDLTSVWRIHDAMIQRRGGGGGGGGGGDRDSVATLPLKNHKKYRVS